MFKRDDVLGEQQTNQHQPMTEDIATTITLPASTPDLFALAQFAKSELAIMREEAEAAKVKAESAYSRGWHIGQACVTIGDAIGPDQFEDYARANISDDYFALYRCTTFALSAPDGIPRFNAAKSKQLMIAFGEEPPPKTTPRKSDAVRFSNVIASAACIKRWWRGGDGMVGLDPDLLRELAECLEPVVAIHAALVAAGEEDSNGL